MYENAVKEPDERGGITITDEELDMLDEMESADAAAFLKARRKFRDCVLQRTL